MPLLWGLKTVPASSHQFSSRSRQILGGPPMQAICCRLFQSASSSSASIFCTYSMADNSPASSLTMPCHERKQNLQHAVTSPTEPQVSHSQARKKSLRALLAALLLVLAMQELPNSDPEEGRSAPRGIWRASCPPLTLRIWSSAVSICSSCCIFCRVTDWLFPFRSCMSVQRLEASATHTGSSHLLKCYNNITLPQQSAGTL